MPIIVHAYKGNVASLKSFIAAEFAGVQVTYREDFAMGTENYTEEFLAKKNPTGQVPVLETPEGFIFESDAMATYICYQNDAGKALLGSSAFEAATVRQWIEFHSNHVKPVLAPWVTAFLPWGSYDAEAVATAKKVAVEGPGKPGKHALKVWDTALQGKEWICGTKEPTLADITMFVNSLYAFKIVLSPEVLKNFPNIDAWAKRCVAHPKFASAAGKNLGDATYIFADKEPEAPTKA